VRFIVEHLIWALIVVLLLWVLKFASRQVKCRCLRQFFKYGFVKGSIWGFLKGTMGILKGTWGFLKGTMGFVKGSRGLWGLWVFEAFGADFSLYMFE
jgi:hypothetical protein